ncbi:hypothetical protein ACJIZ3_000230 [Penstemon smallii]|uniref:Glabrous enhancer-binding protein-like DBD domain-containing protein n=1 Tax=Penstemon smallii TaxID=265156 RepID=A0ABD3RB89_9LAMI
MAPENPIVDEDFEEEKSDSQSPTEKMAPENPIEDSEEEKSKRVSPQPAEENPEDAFVYSDCSSPSDSGFIIRPIPKPKDKKEKKVVNKLFSEKDEIALLQGFARFRAEHGKESDWVKFHSFMKGQLSNEFTKTQLSEKIRSLKRKFTRNFSKGVGLEFPSPHEASVFQHSKTLWEDEVSVDGEKRKRVVELNQEKPSKQRKRAVELNQEKPSKQQKLSNELSKKEFKVMFPLLSASFNEVVPCWVGRENCYLIGREKCQELEDQFRELKAEEIKLGVKRSNLMLKELPKKK